jgi:FkbM family methyltransferase
MYRILSRYYNGIKALLVNFDFFTSGTILLSEISKKLFDPDSISTYSQTGEDRIISAILGNRIGFYVDVGCNHPIKSSNTYYFYKKGWKGITIDANRKLVEQHKRLRIADIAICAAVSNITGEAFFTQFKDTLVSSLDAGHIHEWSNNQKREVESVEKVKTFQLTTLLDQKKCPKSFELLSIDVEGHDYEVLSSLDLMRYRAKLIVIEMHGFDITDVSNSKIYNYLADNNYKMTGFIVMNGYFVDQQIV